MNDTITAEQARAITRLLPALMRRLFTFDDDPVDQLPLAQLRVCAILLGGPRPMSAISRELGVSLSATTQIADRLERARLVRRITAGSDRRVRQLQLTSSGEKIMRRHEEARVQRVRGVLEHLAPKERAEILAALETLLHASGAKKSHDTAHRVVKKGTATNHRVRLAD